MGQPTELKYPHQNLSLLKSQSTGVDKTRLLKHILKCAPGTAMVMATGGFNMEIKAKTHGYFDGVLGAEILQDKHNFAHLLIDLGYQAPRDVLVPANADAELLYDEIAQLDTANPIRFCKPREGTQGRGVKTAHSTEEAINFVKGNKVEYLIQNFLPPTEDWRYILHRDAQQFENGDDPQWRIAYQKVRPSVVGDGQSTVRELISTDAIIPVDSKKKIWKKYKQNPFLDTVPSDQEAVQLIESGNVSQGAYGLLPTGNRLQYMDIFMTQVREHIENKIGGSLGTFCVDIGVTNPEVFNLPYDFEEMKKAIVFYEFQLPFAFTGYVKNMPAEEKMEGLSKLVPESILKLYHQLSVAYLFTKSIFSTGALAQKSL